MTTYNTGNPLGSAAVKDLYDNAENLDHATNSMSSEVWTDRLGVPRMTWHGIQNKAQIDIEASAIAAASAAVAPATAMAAGYRDQALLGSTAAQEARDDAVSAKDQAVSAKDQIWNARDETLTARAETLLARDAAVDAKSEALIASDASKDARDDAIAAAGAIGPLAFYSTYAAANAAVGGLAEGDIVEIAADETHAGARTRYKVQAAALAFMANLDLVRIDLADDADANRGAALVGYFPAGAAGRTVHDKLRESESFQDCGAMGDGSADDTAEVQYAYYANKGAGGAIHASGTFLVTDDQNTMGVPVLGSGRVIKAVPGGFVQSNRAVRVAEHYTSHLWVARNRIISNTALKMVVLGDSTATNGYGLSIDTFVADELRNCGVRVDSVAMASASGHSWGTQNLATVLTGLADQKHLAFIKFGINDASTGDMQAARESLRNAMRQRLAEIRASTYGGVNDLSILLIMPNALGNNASNANNRNNLWLESIHGIYLEAAKDYECAVFDPYAISSNATGGENKWLDSFLVHPNANYNIFDIWGRALELIKPKGSIIRNRFQNLSNAEGGIAPTSTSALSTYNMGISCIRVSYADGWPISCAVFTVRNPDGLSTQTIFGYQQLSYPEVLFRTWVTWANAWSAWNGAATDLSFTISVTANASLEKATYWRTLDKDVVISGIFQNTNAVAGNSQIATLPSGYRPSVQVLRFAKDFDGSSIRLRIYPDGRVMTEAAIAAGTYVIFDSCTFKVA